MEDIWVGEYSSPMEHVGILNTFMYGLFTCIKWKLATWTGGHVGIYSPPMEHLGYNWLPLAYHGQLVTLSSFGSPSEIPESHRAVWI